MVFARFLIIIIFLNSYGIQALWAEETDQFTLPPTELLDIGPITSNKLYLVLESIKNQTNSEIQMLLPRAAHSRVAAAKLSARLKGNYIANLMYKRTGPGYPRWMRWNHIPKTSKPLQFKEIRPWKNVYWLVFSQSPLSLLELAPTINMYNYYFGTDKLGHFFMQGHTYYTLYMYFLNHGKSPEQAHSIMVTYGQILEQTYLGTLINGVYSNGDLSANYAGWKFYMNLTQSVKIGSNTLPPILELKDNQWQFSQRVNQDYLLKPYISDNLSEAYNPCRYTFMRSRIRSQIKKRCPEWIAKQGITPQLVQAKLRETSSWHGENYGHWLPQSNAVTLNTCFGGN